MSSDDDKKMGGSGDFFAKLGETLGDLFEQGRQELVRGAKVGRATMDQRALESDRDKLLAQIGRLAVEAWQAGSISDERLQEPIAKLSALEQRTAAETFLSARGSSVPAPTAP